MHLLVGPHDMLTVLKDKKLICRRDRPPKSSKYGIYCYKS